MVQPDKTHQDQGAGEVPTSEAARRAAEEYVPSPGASAEDQQAELAEAARVAEMTDVAGEKAAQAAQTAQAAQGGEAEADQPSFEDQVRAVERIVLHEPLHREISYKILQFCRERHLLADVEAAIEAMPEYAHATKDPYHLIARLEKAGGLERFPLDADGEIVTAAQLEGLNEDQADDLVRDYAFQTTDAGDQAMENGSPANRMDGLFEAEPERKDTYIELLSFFEEGDRSYQDVCDLLKGRDVLLKPNSEGGFTRMQPSVFVDRLERCGAIVWDNGWQITDVGRRFLDGLAV